MAQHAGFSAYLCGGESSEYLLILCCFPINLKSKVNMEIISKFVVKFQGEGTSRRPLYPGDSVSVSLSDGFLLIERTNAEELRFLENATFDRSWLVSVRNFSDLNVEFFRWVKLQDNQQERETLCKVSIVPRSPVQALRSLAAGKLRVTILASEWSSSLGGVSTINRQLAISLAKHKQVEVTLLVPQSCCSKEEKRVARSYNVAVREAERHPGYDYFECLSFPPRDLVIDIVLGHGVKLGKPARIIRESHSCQWVQVVHTAPEELGMFHYYSKAMAKGEEEIRTDSEVDLCKSANLVVPVGPKLTDAYRSYLRFCKEQQDIIQLTPATFSEFSDVIQAINESDRFKVLTFGRGDPEDFSLKGYDIAVKAIVELNDRSYHLIFVGAPDGEQDEVAGNLLKSGISKDQLTVRQFVKSKERLKQLFCEADLAIMPSRTGGFGLTALEALSAGLPILVSGNSGFGDSLRSLPLGKPLVVDSADPKDWAKAIRAVRLKDRAERLAEIQMLRTSYGKRYNWDDQCSFLVDKMWNMVHGSSVPPEIQAQGPRAGAAYQKALQYGSVEVYRGRLMLLGQASAGKTSLKKTLLGMPFDPNEGSTMGVEVAPTKCEVEVDQVKNWQCTEQTTLDVADFSEDIAKIIVRDLRDLTTIDAIDFKQVDTGGFELSDVSPTLHVGDSTRVPNKENTEELDAPSSVVAETGMPAALLGIDTTAVLPGDVMEMVLENLQDLKLEDDIKTKEVILSVWDFAGQDLFYASHSIFLSLRAVYVLVHNLSKDLSAPAEPRARQGAFDVILENPTNQTNLDNLLSWLVSLHCIRPTADVAEENPDPLRPRVFMVGTHADKPFENIKEMEKCINVSLLGKAYGKHVIKPFFAVDNSRTLSDYGVESLKKKIMEVLKQEPYMGEEVPIRWFNFEKVVEALVEKKTYHMHLDQLLKITKQVCRIDDQEELSTMLNFYHDLGVIVKHGHTVVLQAQWLIDLFKQLITVRPNDMDLLYSESWQELEENGILRMALVDDVFAAVIKEGLSKEDILNMFELYGLIAKFSFLPADSESDEKIYFVPSQLRSSPSSLCEINPSDCDPCPLFFNFVDGFVPHGLFVQLLSRCIKWCSGSKIAPNLFHNGARFYLGNQAIFELILICRNRFIKVTLRLYSDSPPPTRDSATMASKVRDFLEDTLQGMSRELSWLRQLRYKVCVACPHCLDHTGECFKHKSASCAHDDCLHLLPLSTEERMVCRKSFGKEPMQICGLEQWLLDHKTESEEQEIVTCNSEGYSAKRKKNYPCNNTKHPKLMSENLAGSSVKRKGESPCASTKHPKLMPEHLAVKEGTLEDVDLERLAQKIPDHWKKLGRRLLENDEAVLNAIHRENEEYYEKAYKMLLTWKQSKGSGATYSVLHHALCHDLVDRQDLAEKFCLKNS